MKQKNNINVLKNKKIKKINFKNLKKKYIKNKILNNFFIDGKKNTSEKIILKSFKELQKHSDKQSKKLVQLSIIQTLPVFKVNKMSNKKVKKKVREVPSFILNKNARISLAIKFILKTMQKKEYNFFSKFKQEIMLNYQLKSNSVNFKNELQKQALIKEHYLINYKWS